MKMAHRAALRAPSPPADPQPLPTQPRLIPYTIHVPGFDGPLDLLLSLIERNQLEIVAISLVAVTDQFIDYLRSWDEPPMPRLAEFVAMAARLLLIKSRSLLPRAPRQDEEDGAGDPLDDAEQLRRHLLEYKLAKEIATALRARELAGLQTFARPGRLLDAEASITWSPPQVIGVDAGALALTFRRILLEQRFTQPDTLALPTVTVVDRIAHITALITECGTITLQRALEDVTSRLVAVVTFVAILELWHRGHILVRQDALFGPMDLAPGPRWGQTDEDVLANAGATDEPAAEG